MLLKKSDVGERKKKAKIGDNLVCHKKYGIFFNFGKIIKHLKLNLRFQCHLLLQPYLHLLLKVSVSIIIKC